MRKAAFNAGMMDRRLLVQRKQTSRTPSGEEQYSWVEVGRYWAQQDTRTGEEVNEAESIYAFTVTRWRMRYNKTIRVDDRIVDLGARERQDIYDVRAILEEDRRQIMVCLCERFEAEGHEDSLNNYSDPQFSNAFN